MKEKRYHVYISTSFDDVKIERLKLENTLLNLGVFPWEFREPRNALNNSTARRQIEECDYVIFLISSKYGDLSASGISYTHLDFLYALNKQKTIITLIDSAPYRKPIEDQETDPEMQKKLTVFKELLQKDSRYCAHFSNMMELEKVARTQFAKALKENPAMGWVRPKENDYQHNEVTRLKKKIAELEQKLAQAQTNISLAEPVAASQNQDVVIVSYRTHAYQDGNLKDIHPQRELNWLTLLEVLAPHFMEPTQESTFAKVLNDYLESIALEDARLVLPRAHAVARTQIDTRCLQQIKMQMKSNNWIVPQPNLGTSTRIFWKIMPDAEKLLSIK